MKHMPGSRLLPAAAALAILLTGCASDSSSETETLRPPQSLITTAPTAAGTEAIITETEIYNEGGIAVIATGLEEGLFGPAVQLLITNDSENNVVITSSQLSVNGYMFTASNLYCEVAAGKKARDDLTLMSAELERAGIETLGEVAFHLSITDSETYEPIADSGLITLKTAVSGAEAPQPQDPGQLVYDSGSVRVFCQGLKQDLLWDGMVVFYAENHSQRPVTVYAEGVSVNGYMADASLWMDLRPGTRAVDGMYILSMEDLSLENITQVEELEFSLRISDGETWEDIDQTDPIILKF